MDDVALFRANRGCWVLGERADRELVALLSAQGIVRQAHPAPRSGASARWKSTARGFESRLSAGAIVLFVFSAILSGLIEAELRPQGQEQTDKG
ncbi:hypothetical protein [Streptomyces hirsutus]|uniref:hypothetical protein n=1 Tax=Streptomyces hirsutus TaxID=35620 RepID=UPI003697B813